ncbi:MAG: hydroxyacid dehydrogenase [Armatimonadetes bacterium]|nr:hydroxyacid dehydrogenase [Armatimonadota bacterium]
MPDKQKVLYVCTPSHTERVFRPGRFDEMLELFDVTWREEQWTAEEMAEQVPGMDAVVTGWGAPPTSEEFFERADKLQIIAHSAGSVRGLVADELVERYCIPRDIVIFSANGAIARNVAESAVGMLLMTMRHWVQMSNWYHDTGHWRNPVYDYNGQFLQGSTVGVVSASKVGREVIRLLEPWDVTILVYDPWLSDEEAAAMGVESVSLDELFERSDHVTVHAPKLPETEKMIGAEQLARLRDGATLVNTSRGSVIDHDALLAECRARRLNVCLDVTTPEPLPPDSAFRALENVIITPHVSGAGYYGYWEIGDTTIQALLDRFAGRPVRGAVPLERYATIA